jgi:predicted ATPase
MINWLERSVQLAPEDTAEIRLVKLRAKFPLSAQALERLAELLSSSTKLVDAPTDARVRKEQLLAALVLVLTGTTPGQTRLLVLEDAHWSDASTLELVGRLAAQAREHSVLLIVTFRPEFAVPWALPTATAELVLSRLEQRHGARLVARLGEAGGLTQELQSQIVDKAEGVPLFLEELTKSVLESGLTTESDAGRRFQLAVPATLHDALMARLDRLASVKDIAQTAAALGREFSYRLLDACAGLGRRHLQEGLVQLTEAGLLFCNGRPPDASYTFKHALVRDVAYNSLLLSRRSGAACPDCQHAGIHI